MIGDQKPVAAELQLDTDYLVIGAGAMAMAFVDALIENPEVDVIMLDRRYAPGGHWQDAYRFVQLHQPSANYGVNSTYLGQDQIEISGPEHGMYERASGAAICSYFDEIMRKRLLASGRVRFFPMCEYLGGQRFCSLLTGQQWQVHARRKLVDATYQASRTPATEPAPFEVADGARCVPIGGLVKQTEPPAGYVIIGGGKTALDAICWLLDQGTDPDRIQWIRPRDSWVLNRAFFQPHGSVVNTFKGTVLQLESIAASASVEEVYDRLEQQGLVLRTEPGTTPSMMKGGTLSLAELAQLQRIKNVIRLGHVLRIEPDRIVLERGSVPTTSGHLHVHCAAIGLSTNPPVAVFMDDQITLQCLSRVSLTLSAAIIGLIETSPRSTAEKNRLCIPNPLPDTPFDWLRILSVGLMNEKAWLDEADVRNWLDHSRLNLIRGLKNSGKDQAVAELQGRFLASIMAALAKVGELARHATAAEQSRFFQPSIPDQAAETRGV
jgi:hypothetical protein